MTLRLISRIDRPRTKFSLISAHCSTPITSVLPSSLCARKPGSADHRTILRWSAFQPAQVVQFSPGDDTRGPTG